MMGGVVTHCRSSATRGYALYDTKSQEKWTEIDMMYN
jgi:hypothetical protein